MLKRSVFFVSFVLLPTLAAAAPPACPEHFFHGQAPDMVNQKLGAEARELCYTGFAVLYSGVTRTPLWSAEHLTQERLAAAHGVRRQGTFHPDPNVPQDERAELSDYARSGFDRGHMSPSGDMPNRKAQNESFSLANMVPQNPNNNRYLWEGIESAVRNFADQEGDLYVLTGPLFEGETLQRLHGRVLVPTAVFKAVYDPKRREAGAYVTPNAAGDKWEDVSISDLEKRSGIDVFPDLPAEVKDHAMMLPTPIPHGHPVSGRGHPRRTGQTPSPAPGS
jgi:endonuclease G, mitochondrial